MTFDLFWIYFFNNQKPNSPNVERFVQTNAQMTLCEDWVFGHFVGQAMAYIDEGLNGQVKAHLSHDDETDKHDACGDVGKCMGYCLCEKGHDMIRELCLGVSI